MNHFKSSLSVVTAVASVLGAAACGGQQAQANAPSGEQTTAESQEHAGATMGQPNANTAGMDQTGGTSAGATSDQSATSGATSYGQGGASGTVVGAMPSATTGSSQGGAGSMSGASNSAAPQATQPDASGLDDAQVAAVIQVINEGEIQQAQLAQSKAKSPEVRRFAQHMLTAHRDMENKDKKLLVRLQLVPQDSAVSSQVKTEGENQLSTLQGITGQDFDRDYIELQVSGHNKALELIDRMVPNLKSGDLKIELQNARPMVAQHLSEAERIHQHLQKGTTDEQRGSGKPEDRSGSGSNHDDKR